MTLKQREEAQFLLKMPITFHINVLEDAGKQTAATSPLQGLILLNLVANALWFLWYFWGSDRTTEGADGACTVPVVQEGGMNLCHSQHLFSCQQAPRLVCSALSHTETPVAGCEPKQTNPPSFLHLLISRS